MGFPLPIKRAKGTRKHDRHAPRRHWSEIRTRDRSTTLASEDITPICKCAKGFCFHRYGNTIQEFQVLRNTHSYHKRFLGIPKMLENSGVLVFKKGEGYCVDLEHCVSRFVWFYFASIWYVPYTFPLWFGNLIAMHVFQVAYPNKPTISKISLVFKKKHLTPETDWIQDITPLFFLCNRFATAFL